MTITHPVGIDITVEVQWDVTYIDITSDVRFIDVRTSQRSRLQNTFDPGRATLTLDNSTRKYDPLYASGPYYGLLKPGRPMRITIDSGTASPTHKVFVGTTDAFVIDYDRSNRDSTVQLVCVDSLARASQMNVLAGDTPTFSSVETDFWLSAIFTAAYATLTTNGVDFEYGVFHYSAELTDEWDATTAHNVLDEIRRAADVEQGPAFSSLITYAGVVVHPRHWFKMRPRSATSQASFGDGDLPFYNIKTLFDADEIVTAVSMSDQDGNTVQAIDAAGVTAYGFRAPFATYDRLPTLHDEALEGAANTVIALRATEEFRIDELVIKPGADTAFQKYVPELTLLDRITVAFTPTRVSPEVSADYFIDGITHQISPGDWTTTYSLWQAGRFDAALPGTLFTVDSSLVDGSHVVGL